MIGIQRLIAGSGGFDIDALMDVVNLQSDTSDLMTIGAGNRISSWRDAIGNDFLQATDGSRPTLTSGIPVGDGGDTLALAGDISLGSVFSLYFVFKNTGGLTKIPFASRTVNDYSMLGSLYNFQLVSSTAGGFDTKAGVSGQRYHIFSFRRNGNAAVVAKVNDRTLIVNASTFHATNPTYLGKLWDRAAGGFTFTGGIRALCVSSECLSDEVNEQVIDALYTRYNLSVDNAPANVCGFGDSNTSGQGATSYLVGLASSLGIAYLQLGISGTLFTNVGATPNNGYDRWLTQIITRPYSDYLVVQYGTNDLSNNVVYDAQMRERLQETLDAGYNPDRICLCSNPYRAAGANAAELIAREIICATIASDLGIKYFDLYGAMLATGVPDTLLSDPVHLNAAGQTIWQNGVYTALTTP